MRWTLGFILAASVLFGASCGEPSTNPSASGSGPSSSSCAKGNLHLVQAGQLTIGTDNPAYPPWFAGGTKSGSKWKINDPTTGKGYESAVAYAVAKGLGFSRDEVQWTYVPFSRAFAPGPKPFDFDINQISDRPQRAKAVDFSDSYYDVNQALVVNKGTPIASVHSIAGLRPFKLGAQLGTTSYDYITTTIKPSQKPAVFPSNAGAVQALKNKQIDGLVVDLPTAFYVTGAQVPGSTVLGQFPSLAGEHFGMVFAKGNPLVSCVNKTLGRLRANGTLQHFQDQWLAKATGAAILK
ncbi:MAG TPA: transporter substrate-binding domain-containing protein [Actinomycetota bacterium]|jgi:polar amino acid transport system substrate-binding protein|nr:transporter substrate-binding domain-containing protein [Actinomycetota bacterium]